MHTYVTTMHNVMWCSVFVLTVMPVTTVTPVPSVTPVTTVTLVPGNGRNGSSSKSVL